MLFARLKAISLRKPGVMLQVGSEVARRARGLGFNVIAYDPYASEAKAAAMGVKIVPFDEALSTADFFSLHMPLTPDTKVLLSYSSTHPFLSCTYQDLMFLFWKHSYPKTSSQTDFNIAKYLGFENLFPECFGCHKRLSQWLDIAGHLQ